ncbi:hypothetical protein PAPYR_2952 [Paratrimastix pyriformis]|uniref:Uncharacterized protein n=1 Tax=Paratrimastix pyriformis TaxID=342808 RepID=A0ABQ8UNG4_9EUKA|nr:hypothetical protein PAPYR_2952 [Paratrimastix pyriformis]
MAPVLLLRRCSDIRGCFFFLSSVAFASFTLGLICAVGAVFWCGIALSHLVCCLCCRRVPDVEKAPIDRTCLGTGVALIVVAGCIAGLVIMVVGLLGVATSTPGLQRSVSLPLDTLGATVLPQMANFTTDLLALRTPLNAVAQAMAPQPTFEEVSANLTLEGASWASLIEPMQLGMTSLRSGWGIAQAYLTTGQTVMLVVALVMLLAVLGGLAATIVAACWRQERSLALTVELVLGLLAVLMVGLSACLVVPTVVADDGCTLLSQPDPGPVLAKVIAPAAAPVNGHGRMLAGPAGRPARSAEALGMGIRPGQVLAPLLGDCSWIWTSLGGCDLAPGSLGQVVRGPPSLSPGLCGAPASSGLPEGSLLDLLAYLAAPCCPTAPQTRSRSTEGSHRDCAQGITVAWAHRTVALAASLAALNLTGLVGPTAPAAVLAEASAFDQAAAALVARAAASARQMNGTRLRLAIRGAADTICTALEDSMGLGGLGVFWTALCLVGGAGFMTWGARHWPAHALRAGGAGATSATDITAASSPASSAPSTPAHQHRHHRHHEGDGVAARAQTVGPLFHIQAPTGALLSDPAAGTGGDSGAPLIRASSAHMARTAVAPNFSPRAASVQGALRGMRMVSVAGGRATNVGNDSPDIVPAHAVDGGATGTLVPLASTQPEAAIPPSPSPGSSFLPVIPITTGDGHTRRVTAGIVEGPRGISPTNILRSAAARPVQLTSVCDFCVVQMNPPNKPAVPGRPIERFPAPVRMAGKVAPPVQLPKKK